ncbi:DUF6908 domain-containing protein [Halopiger aswanensis]|uniref:DUF6908 domain-containing protein n=1 Tax=Halopiger aswanensis TaxID=148449 RepID=A0A3R7FWB8_9EURY|nr:hypothetical protein [Halopiger aswanensis]RKD95654.1 hypothetical protein ATJ93_2515 [Halopiger aswanensis]
MKTVKEILEQFGINSISELETGQTITVENNGYMDLVIEKVGEERVVVGHYYRQMGDRTADPEIVFKVRNGDWIPVRYTQNPGVHQHDEDGLEPVQEFVKEWSRNLRIQGFVDAAKEQELAQ